MPGTKDQRKQRKEGKETEQWFVVVWENDCAKTEKAFIVALGDNNVLQWDAIQRGKWSSFRGLQSLLGQQVRAQQNKKKKDNFTLVVTFTWAKEKDNEWLQPAPNNPLINRKKNVAMKSSWKCFPYLYPRWHLRRRWPALWRVLPY